MKEFNEVDIGQAFEGKTYIAERLRKIAIASGDTSAVVFSRRLTRSEGALIGITDEIFYKWWDDGIYFSVIINLDTSSHTIEHCYIRKSNEEYINIPPTQQDLVIFQNIMQFITNE